MSFVRCSTHHCERIVVGLSGQGPDGVHRNEVGPGMDSDAQAHRFSAALLWIQLGGLARGVGEQHSHHQDHVIDMIGADFATAVSRLTL